jgi:hypothetical protein
LTWLIRFTDQKVRVRIPPRAPRNRRSLHFDIKFYDLEQAVAHAVRVGAEQAEYQPQKNVRVLLHAAGITRSVSTTTIKRTVDLSATMAAPYRLRTSTRGGVVHQGVALFAGYGLDCLRTVSTRTIA